LSIVIERLLAPTAVGALAIVRHGSSSLEIEVVGGFERLAASVGELHSVEFSYDAVGTWRMLEAAERVAHGLFASEPGSVRFVGVVHFIISTADGQTISDVYVQAGQERVAVDAANLPGANLHSPLPPGLAEG